MKREVLFVQGAGEGAHTEWDARLVASLRQALGRSYEIHYPRMPCEADPRYDRWKTALEAAFETLPEDAVLVGHSVGGTILVNLLAAQRPTRSFGALMLLAAPFIGDGGWPSDDLEPPRDLGAHLPEGLPVHLFHGLADGIVPPSHLGLYARAIPRAYVHPLPGRDHQFNNDLREVAEAILSIEMRR